MISVDELAAEIAAARSVRPRLARLAVVDVVSNFAADASLYDHVAGQLTGVGAAYVRGVLGRVLKAT